MNLSAVSKHALRNAIQEELEFMHKFSDYDALGNETAGIFIFQMINDLGGMAGAW